MRKPVIDVSGAVWVAACGACIGVIAALLTRLGNPIDGGISVACFARDIAVAVLGMTAGAAFAYNFNTAFIAGDIETAGKIVVIGGIVFFCVIGYTTGRREWRVGKGSRKSE